jgi:acyl-CoA synthetase (AMP-forming)/AMP-acid ligase II
LRADGEYEFLGRRDNMIKTRGYRVELGEVEAAIYGHPAVREAAVIAIPDPQIGNALKAVIAVREEQDLRRGELESFCAQRLPKYMIPTMIETRTSLPKTSTGKVDKTRLVNEHLERRQP